MLLGDLWGEFEDDSCIYHIILQCDNFQVLSGYSAPDVVAGLRAIIALVLRTQYQLVDGEVTAVTLLILFLIALHVVTENFVPDYQECKKKGRNLIPDNQDPSIGLQHHWQVAVE